MLGSTCSSLDVLLFTSKSKLSKEMTVLFLMSTLPLHGSSEVLKITMKKSVFALIPFKPFALGSTTCSEMCQNISMTCYSFIIHGVAYCKSHWGWWEHVPWLQLPSGRSPKMCLYSDTSETKPWLRLTPAHWPESKGREVFPFHTACGNRW